ncbi:TssN family type VI secretion system protein [Lewinella sp. IMCC34183]|uniref:TssN family type VI secretion system protein n=1 Tax=Lewinella sp. IMCC34183 TaxID=2248762 RepID=UPI000E253938|nr:TssN family type VI secretion system protein [Lewinella sp. IMCC34183]
MSYSTASILLAIMLLVGVVWMFATRGEKKIFTGKLVGLALRTVGFSVLFATAGLLYREPVGWLSIPGLFLLLTVIYSLFAWWYWHKQQLVYLDERAILQWEFPQAFSLWALSSLVLLGGLVAKQLRYAEGGAAGAMLYVVPAALVMLLPPVVVYAHRMWLRIPIVIRFREPWMLPLRQDAPVIEPSADAVRLFFEIPIREEGPESVSFDVSVPRRTSLSQVFHHLLYEHNVHDRSHRRIAIAYNNKSDYLYGWLLFRRRRKWWGPYRDYLAMEDPLRQTDLMNGETVYAERVRVWENQKQQS